MYYTFVGIIFFAAFAMSVQHGIWNNLLTLMAISIGGLTAFGAHQPLVIWIDEYTDGSYTYLWDFLALWFVFAITTGLLKEIAGRLSKNRVNFPDQVDNYGGAVIGLLIAGVMVAFSMATFHTAPLSYDQFGGTFEYGTKVSEVRQSLDSASALSKPDVAWLRFADSTLSAGALGQTVAGLGGSAMDGFDSALWVQQQGQHRKTFGEERDSIFDRK